NVVVTSSMGLSPLTICVKAWYRWGKSGDHNCGFETFMTCLISFSLLAASSTLIKSFSVLRLSGPESIVLRRILWGLFVSFFTRVLIWTVAAWEVTRGVVIPTPHCATWILSVTISQTWRYIPEPLYQREFFCFELSTRTERTFSLPESR